MAAYPHIETTPGVAGGRARIAGRRVTVADVAVWHERARMTADEISDAYDLTLAEIHAALAYYFDHRAAVDAHIAEDEALADRVRAATPSRLPDALRRSPDAA